MKTFKIYAVLCLLLSFGIPSLAQSVILRIYPKINPTHATGMIITYWQEDSGLKFHIGEEPNGVKFADTFVIYGLLPDVEYRFAVSLVSRYGIGAQSVGIAVAVPVGGTATVYLNNVPEPPYRAISQMTPTSARTGFQGIDFLDFSPFREKQQIPYKLNE